jgi:hypothetical protein
VQADDVAGDLGGRRDTVSGRKVVAPRQPCAPLINGESPGG